MKWARVLLFVSTAVWVGNAQRPDDPWQVGKDGVPYTPETGAVRAQSDLKADSYLRVAAITGHPFSAWIVTTVKQVAEDGTPRTYVARDLVARDAQGRWYCEHRMHPASGNYAPGRLTAQAWDPVTRTFLNLEMAGKTALLSKEEGAYTPPDRPRGKMKPFKRDGMYAGNESTVMEDIGTRSEDGILEWGQRWTTTFAPGVMGSSKPLTTVTEYWYSDELAVDMEIHAVNPMKGDVTIHVEQVDRHEPPQSLFEVPPGFKERIFQKP
jgi:hypothetical protein